MTQIEDIFSCRGRTVVLKTLAKQEASSVYAISKQVKLSHNCVLRHLKAFMKLDIVTVGECNSYRFADNIRAQRIQQFILDWGGDNDSS